MDKYGYRGMTSYCLISHPTCWMSTATEVWHPTVLYHSPPVRRVRLEKYDILLSYMTPHLLDEYGYRGMTSYCLISHPTCWTSTAIEVWHPTVLYHTLPVGWVQLQRYEILLSYITPHLLDEYSYRGIRSYCLISHPICWMSTATEVWDPTVLYHIPPVGRVRL